MIMSDKQKENMGEEEYQFPTDEYAEEETMHDELTEHTDHEPKDESEDETNYSSGLKKPKAASLVQRFPFLRNKRIIGTIVIVIVVIIGFNIYHRVTNETKIIEKTKVAQTPVVPVKPVTTPLQQQPQFSQPNPEMVGQISQLQQVTSTEQTSLTQLQTQVKQLKTQLQKNSQTTAALKQMVQALVGQMRSVAQMATHQAQTRTVTHKNSLPPAPQIVYHVKAVIPGRAWIVGSNGISTTVRVGQTLKNYGKIEAINPNRGLVLTSSGKIIAYGPDDS